MLYTFDGTFDGLLCCVFDAFARKDNVTEVLRPWDEIPLFCLDDMRHIETELAHARRVWIKLEKCVSKTVLNSLVKSFLHAPVEVSFYSTLFRFICRAVTSATRIEGDFGDADVLAVLNNSRKVSYEASRMRQFVRFQKAVDGTYFAMMEPLYDVLPLAIGHFVDRFADSRFIIYDRARGYGFFYDGNELHRIVLSSDAPHMVTGNLDETIADTDEAMFKKLWRTYFNATAIPERTNPRKQRQDMPRRFWKYLTEVNGL